VITVENVQKIIKDPERLGSEKRGKRRHMALCR